jgi:hypothetical protein
VRVLRQRIYRHVLSRVSVRLRTSLAASLLAVTLLPASPTSALARVPCGVDRWDVKTLSDPAAHQVDFTPVDRSVTVLRHLNGPVVHEDSPRLGGIERQVIRVRAQVVMAKVEDDSDIHLVIASRTNRSQTMIVEFPHPKCVASAFKLAQMRSARRSLISGCPAIGSSDFTTLHGNVVIRGVGFWDILHGQTGVAPNGIELHPVIWITGTCWG